MVRNVPVGGDAPVSIQSMCNVPSGDEEGILRQISELTDEGCEIVRLAVPDEEGLSVFRRVRERTDTPLVADIHFDYRLALGAIEAGADKVRINPGNIGHRDRVRMIVDSAKAHHIPVRVGVNSGSVEKDILAKYGRVTAAALAESALRNVRLIEDMGFDDIVISMKSSDVKMNYDAHIAAARETDHPFHIGITEAGTPERGRIKSAVGIGALLLSGIGNTIRVSLTADPKEEVRFAKKLLEASGLRTPCYDIVSCPTCGRTGIDLEGLVRQVEDRLMKERGLPRGLKIAVMGCAVNGPGEAKEADYGVCGGLGKGVIIRKGEPVLTADEAGLADALVDVIREDYPVS